MVPLFLDREGLGGTLTGMDKCRWINGDGVATSYCGQPTVGVMPWWRRLGPGNASARTHITATNAFFSLFPSVQQLAVVGTRGYLWGQPQQPARCV